MSMAFDVVCSEDGLPAPVDAFTLFDAGGSLDLMWGGFESQPRPQQNPVPNTGWSGATAA
jgi:hypothetical protein